jgi:hypothetical protein
VSDETVTVTMPLASAKDLIDGNGGYRAKDAIEAALAAHEAAKNPLGTPWTAERHAHCRAYCVSKANGHELASFGDSLGTGTAEATARLMAAAPELADALEAAEDLLWERECSCSSIGAALKKAGRR